MSYSALLIKRKWFMQAPLIGVLVIVPDKIEADCKALNCVSRKSLQTLHTTLLLKHFSRSNRNFEIGLPGLSRPTTLRWSMCDNLVRAIEKSNTAKKNRTLLFQLKEFHWQAQSVDSKTSSQLVSSSQLNLDPFSFYLAAALFASEWLDTRTF